MTTCICPLYKLKNINFQCAHCYRNIEYTPIKNINDKDEDEIKLKQLKEKLSELIIEKTILKMDIEELEFAIKNKKKT
jgi:hypothetical protein